SPTPSCKGYRIGFPCESFPHSANRILPRFEIHVSMLYTRELHWNHRHLITRRISRITRGHPRVIRSIVPGVEGNELPGKLPSGGIEIRDAPDDGLPRHGLVAKSVLI